MKLNLIELRSGIVSEHNKLRTNPKSYITLLQNHLAQIKDNILTIPNELKLKLIEGESSYNEAISFLQNLNITLKPMEHNNEISEAANDHATDIGSNGLFSHESSDGKNTAERIEKYIEWDGACCESIEFGNRSAESIIISLLVDDGIEHRPHRKNIFSEELKYFGVGVSEHRTYGVVTVIDYLAGIREEDGKVNFDYENFKYDIRGNVSPIKKLKKAPINEKLEGDENRNPFQLDDPDAPNDTISVQIFKKSKKRGDVSVHVTKKMYKLENGTYHIVEVEEQT